MRRLVRLVAVLVLLAACDPGIHREARVAYNDGVAALGKGDFAAAEKSLTDARSQAGVDPELRFRAAYDLGVAYAGDADAVRRAKDADLEKALDLSQRALSWFADAARLRKDDADTQANLAVMRARVQAISDELRKGEGRLEARLDAVIAEQRSVLEDARGAWLQVREAGGSDPLAHQGTLTHLADRERGVVADAGVVGDLAQDEIDAISRKQDEERSDEEKGRLIQLRNLALYVHESRGRIGDARRKLQTLAAEDGVARAEAALVALKRAREQLLDPVTVLRGVAQDQLALLGETNRAGGGAQSLTAPPVVDVVDVGAPAPAAPEAVPVWLAPAALAGRQGGLRDRVEEVRARLEAFAGAKPEAGQAAAQAAGQAAAPPQDPKEAKLRERVQAALPAVAEASAEMTKASDALAKAPSKDAIAHEEAAVDALARAVEEFLDLKDLIEVAWAQQQEISALLSDEAAKEIAPADRARRTKEGIARNVARMGRLRELIADAVADLDAETKKAAAAAPAAKGGTQPGADEAHEQQRKRLELGESLRAQAATALGGLDHALASNGDPRPPAAEADARLTELRKLFFSVIQHLEQLIRDQGETRDRTSAARAEDASARAPKLPEITRREDDHGTMAQAITDALAKQADEASKAQATPGPAGGQGGQAGQGGPDAKALAGAVEEMRLARNEITDASGALVRAADPKTPPDPKASDESLDAAVKSQANAMEHLVAARKLLEPPPKDQQGNDQQQQGGAAQAKPEKKKEDDTPRAGGAAQRARDEDARRQRERQAREGKSDPVEKDW